MGKMNSPLLLLLAAKEFFENGSNYAGKYFRVKDGKSVATWDGTIHAKLAVPATNIAFGLELALKGLLMQHGSKSSSHDLHKLFGSLPVDVRSAILQHYASHNTYNNFITVRIQNNSPGRHGSLEGYREQPKTEQAAMELLDQHKNAFVKFRYLHEFKDQEIWQFYFKELSNLTLSTLVTLGAALGQTVVVTERKKPE